MVSIDLGCGSYPRADVGVDIQFRHCTSPHLDRWLAPFGFKYNPNAKLVEHDLNSFPYPFGDNSADKILLCHVLEHLEKPIDVLREIKRILKPSGLLVIVWPNPKTNLADKNDKEHKYSWTPWAMENLLSYVGFRVEKIIEVVGGLDLLAVAKKP